MKVAVDIIIDLVNRDERTLALITRKDNGKTAIPGGLVEENESAIQAAIREAKEETNLDIRNVIQFATYSDPTRDPRGRVISIVYLAHAIGTPVAGDDAKFAREVPLKDLDVWLEDMAFDHAKILTDYIAFLKEGERPNE